MKTKIIYAFFFHFQFSNLIQKINFLLKKKKVNYFPNTPHFRKTKERRGEKTKNEMDY